MKHLITPLYRMSSSQAPANKIRFPQAQEHLLSQRQLIIPDAARLCNMFSALQNATAQAVKIYRLSRMDDEHHTDQKSLRDKQNKLLDALQSTIDDVPPFTLGENALVWALYTAAMSSTRMAHRIFFTSKLAAILERVELDEANRPWYM